MFSRILVLGFALSATLAQAGVVISQVPLAKASSQPVPPNLLFILDDSGSMGWDYTPDHVDDSLCRSTSSTSSLTACRLGHPPYAAAPFNKQYYNPRIRYSPGVKSDGVSYPEMDAVATTNWTQVPTDGYKTSPTKVNIVTQYPDLEWGNGSGTYKRNTTYAYPDNTYTNSYSQSYTTNPYYYNLQPIYCTSEDATNCADVKGGSYLVEVSFRWCSDTALTTCQAKKTSTFKYPSFIKPESGVAGKLVLTLTGCAKYKTQSLDNVTIGGVNQLTGKASYASSNSTSCTSLADAIVAKQSASAQFTAARTQSGSTSKITYTAKTPGTWANLIPVGVAPTYASASGSITTNGSDSQIYFSRVDIVPTTTKYQVDGGKPSGRTDCITPTHPDGCTYAEEMTNFANWYAYYRTRMQTMKTAVSIAFKDIDNRFRIGYTQINSLSSNYLKIHTFDSTQRALWYDKLLKANPSGNTPLLSAMSFAGRVYAGQKPSGISDDPLQYSCQQNFTLLTTDGYTNESNIPKQIDGSTAIGNQDGGPSPKDPVTGNGTDRPYYEGPTTTYPANTLADTAMYYYKTDLRTAALGNCNSPLTGADVCEDNVPISSDDKNQQQHMTTYTLGLGVDGQLRYQSDYKTALSGDFQSIKTGSLNWPTYANNAATAVDDLWHAAVNGRGEYFSAQDPAVLVASLKGALSSISQQFGSGAAAATSNLEPVSGDNYIYVATYTTGKWTGNLEARTIDLVSGTPSKQCVWAVEDVPADPVALTTACTGKMSAKVDLTSDTRKIYFNKSGTLTDFLPGNMAAGDKAPFDVTKLSQYVGWSPEYKTEATTDRMIEYMRGRTGYDTRDSNTYRLFRQREAVLGDIVDSKPVFYCAPTFDYPDPAFDAYKLAQTTECSSGTRQKMIYVGANDGMLHAFNADTGTEEWAFVPTPALAEMWRLADNNYSNSHRFYVDGAPHVQNICVANCDNATTASWKPILIGALGYGVVEGDDPATGAPYSGFFALDISKPLEPKLLWEINSKTTAFSNMIGFSPGNVSIGKLSDGKWVAVFASGYNPGDGKARVFVVDAYTGAKISSIALPSEANGLSRIRLRVDEPLKDSTFTYAYGGDLNGNVWRVDVNTGDTKKIFSAAGKPFTTRPEVAVCNDKAVIYIGSGKFFESGDLTDKNTQTLYSFVDDYDISGTLDASALSSVGITTAGASRTIGAPSGVGYPGWSLNLPDVAAAGGSERINIDPVLMAGTLVFQSNVPDAGVCVASGHSWTNAIQLRSCQPSDKVPQVITGTSQHAGNELGVGITIVKIGGTYVPIVTGSGGGVKAISGIPIGTSDTSPQGVYTGWRELIRN